MNKLILVGCLLLAASTSSSGKIKNGYSPQIEYWKKIMPLDSSFAGEISRLDRRRRAGNRFHSMQTVITYAEITDHVLRQLKMISPDIYDEIDRLTDPNGNPVDVFIKIIPKEHSSMPFQGVTRFVGITSNNARPWSEYGVGTVSINVWFSTNVLVVLCHELGHVSYVLPHYHEYKIFYRKHYLQGNNDSNHLGHDVRDESGRRALSFEKRFQKDYLRYLNSGGMRFASVMKIARQ